MIGTSPGGGIQNRSDVIDVDESELQSVVQQCTQQQAPGDRRNI